MKRSPHEREQLVSPEYLRERFDYDPSTGELVWKYDSAGRPQWNALYAGKIAGADHANGYRIVSLKVDGEKMSFLVHRVAWAIVNGAWPKNTVDHENGCRSDNRIGNLREATVSEQRRNRTAVSGKSRFKGVVVPHPAKGKLPVAQIFLDGATRFLGAFATEEDAARAYDAAAIKYFGEFAKTNAALGLL